MIETFEGLFKSSIFIYALSGIMLLYQGSVTKKKASKSKDLDKDFKAFKLVADSSVSLYMCV